ncbi:hypothetical protein TSUD_332040 [Trifolium subterraneum]|uniref:Uncharacterized protein n=1 Tax=Trifolium subterraneum TaxID=3900 RepID=A0A2Z6MZJ0_TRISU|nr:hypothetical protein TSUD_332040 [Trifolium subterraneum]
MLEARGIAPSENRNLALGDIDRAQGRREVVADHFLVECATGYALFLANGISDIGDPTKYTVKYEAAKEYINRPVTPFVLKDYVAFTSHEDALIEMNSILKSNVTDKLIEFLKKNFEPPFNHHELVTADFRLGLLILKKLGLGNYSSFLTNLVMRALRERIDEFIKLPHGDLDKAQRHLTCLYKDHMRTKLDIKSPVSSFLQEHKPGSRVIYVGNVCGLTVSDLSDLVGQYSAEAGFISSHAKFYLKAGGHYMICTKGNNTNSMGHAIFSHLYTASEFKPIQTVTLDLVEGAYALDIGGCRMPDE